MKILVTAGPTREFVDSVRFLSNRSTGKMGYAIAEAGRNRGHEVRLVSGPVSLEAPDVDEKLDIVSAADMLSAVKSNIEWCDVLVMTAAVADWRPSERRDQKIKKGADSFHLELVPTQDILKAIAPLKGDRLFVGFAADDGDAAAEAERKLEEKQLDAIVSNDISRDDAGFEVDTNKVVIFQRHGAPIDIPLMSKRELGVEIIKYIERAV
ncbi:hypothetical protein BVX97_05010 [bacterium E08(2017)]|nr:hypothetical protein BVX97_05010 [bacterium E08(2017)]